MKIFSWVCLIYATVNEFAVFLKNLNKKKEFFFCYNFITSELCENDDKKQQNNVHACANIATNSKLIIVLTVQHTYLKYTS